MDPESRPTFDEIFINLQSNDFGNFPGANSKVIREYVKGVLAWEARYSLSKQSSKSNQE
jgi:hypothetical protein